MKKYYRKSKFSLFFILSYASTNFPSQLLQSGVKVSLEFARGIQVAILPKIFEQQNLQIRLEL